MVAMPSLGKPDAHHCSVHPGFLGKERERSGKALQRVSQSWHLGTCVTETCVDVHVVETCPARVHWPTVCQHYFILQTCGLKSI